MAAAVAAACVALLTVAAAVFVSQVHAVDILGDPETGRMGWGTLLAPAVLILAGAAVAGTLLVVAMRLLREQTPTWPAVVVTGVVTVAAAFLVTTPTAVSYSDGCNQHDDVAPAVAVPCLKAAGPENSKASYFGYMTAMACSPMPIDISQVGG